MPTGSSFIGDATGGGINIQEGRYSLAFDVAPYPATAVMDWTYASGDEILDLTNPAEPTGPAGMYFLVAAFWWNESETGAALNLDMAMSPVESFLTVDLGVIHPSAAAGGYSDRAFSKLAAADGQTLVIGAWHSRATDNLTGGVDVAITRMY